MLSPAAVREACCSPGTALQPHLPEVQPAPTQRTSQLPQLSDRSSRSSRNRRPSSRCSDTASQAQAPAQDVCAPQRSRAAAAVIDVGPASTRTRRPSSRCSSVAGVALQAPTTVPLPARTPRRTCCNARRRPRRSCSRCRSTARPDRRCRRRSVTRQMRDGWQTSNVHGLPSLQSSSVTQWQSPSRRSPVAVVIQAVAGRVRGRRRSRGVHVFAPAADRARTHRPRPHGVDEILVDQSVADASRPSHAVSSAVGSGMQGALSRRRQAVRPSSPALGDRARAQPQAGPAGR